MRIEILHIDDCPNSEVALENARAAAAVTEGERSNGAGAEIEVIERRIASAEDAAAVSFAGSPTILIDGVDLEPGAQTTDRLACRVYRTPAGLAGSPTIEQIAAAIRLQLR